MIRNAANPRGRIAPGFVMRQVAGQTVIVATGEASRTFHGMIRVNGSGTVIWQGLMDGLDDEAIVDRLLDRYEVDRATARRDVDAFVTQARDHGFLAA